MSEKPSGARESDAKSTRCELAANADEPAWRTPWSDEFPSVVRSIARGEPLVALVYIPLCSNEQVDCGSNAAGRPGDLSTNLYWGAGFGAAKFFDRRRSPWEHVKTSRGKGPVLEERIYRRTVSRRHWQASLNRLSGACQVADHDTVEQLVVLRAVHGSAIDEAVSKFWAGSTDGVEVEAPSDDGGSTTHTAHIVGYAGHNRMLDGLTLPALDLTKQRAEPKTASFVLACYSENTFEESLLQGGSRPLVMTRALMAPEGYVIDAVVRALGENATAPMLRKRVVKAYATWQRIPEERASLIFSR